MLSMNDIVIVGILVLHTAILISKVQLKAQLRRNAVTHLQFSTITQRCLIRQLKTAIRLSGKVPLDPIGILVHNDGCPDIALKPEVESFLSM